MEHNIAYLEWMNQWIYSLFYYIIMTVTIVKILSYTLKSLCSMVAKEALKSLLYWQPEVSVLYVIIEWNKY